MSNGYSQELVNEVNAYSPIVDLIYQLESDRGTNKKAYIENEYGAKGGYQIKRDTYKDLQRIHPEKWKHLDFDTVALNDNLSRKAAEDYVRWIEKYYVDRNITPSIENILLGYHSGVGNVRKGKIGKQGLEYIRKAHTLMGFDEGRIN